MYATDIYITIKGRKRYLRHSKMTATASHHHASRVSPPPPSPPKDAERDIVAEAALAALEMANGDQTKAAKELEARVGRDAALKRALLNPLIAYACHNAVGLQIRAQRDRVWNPPAKPSASSDSDRVKALAAGNLLLFPLPGGKMLGDALKGDVVAAATFYDTQSRDMAHKGRWLNLVAGRIPEGKAVRHVLDEGRLAALKAEAA